MRTKLKLLSLISGGLDSPVASYFMLKSGYNIDFVFFDIFGETEQIKGIVKQLKKQLKIENGMKLFIVPYNEILKAMSEKSRNFLCILCKRMMLRIANKIGGDALITGDSLGQVASQTIENLFCEDKASRLPVLRPLIGFDKSEIILVAKNIGTYDLQINRSCPFTPRKPKTKAKLKQIKYIEKEIEIDKLTKTAIKNMKTIMVF